MFDFVADHFEIENTNDYTLSIQLSLNGFSFCINRADDKSVLAFKSTPLKISSQSLLARRFKDWFSSENVLQKHYQKTRLIILSHIYTLVPQSLHQNDLNEELSYLLFDKGEQLHLAENLVASLDAKLLFALPDDFQPAISETIGECDVLHPIKLLIEQSSKMQINSAITLLFNANDLHVLIHLHKKLVLSNVYTINHSNDAVYYLLNAAKQFGINTKETPLFYSGKSVFSDGSIKQLHHYFTTARELPATNESNAEKVGKQQVTENISLFL